MFPSSRILVLLAWSAGIVSAEGTSTRNRSLSDGVSSALSAGFTYNPPKPEPEKEEPKPEDQPRNGIVRLPNYVVLGQKPPVFSERNLYTKKELAKVAKQRYLSEFDRGVLNRFSGPSWSNMSTEKRAMQAYYDDEREKAIEESKRNIYLYKESGDDSKAALAQEESYSTAYRSSTPSYKKDNGTWFGETK